MLFIDRVYYQSIGRTESLSYLRSFSGSIHYVETPNFCMPFYYLCSMINHYGNIPTVPSLSTYFT